MPSTRLACLAAITCFAALAGCADLTATDVDVGVDRDAAPFEPERDAAVGCSLGRYGAVCTSGDECCSGLCVEAARGSICSDRCAGPEDCPPGARCASLGNAGVDVTFVCVPDITALCRPCEQDDDCDDPEDRCLPIGRGMYCAEDCTNAPCPEGYICDDVPGEDGQSTRQCLPESGLCEGCDDPDGDGYGVGADCAGIDCDEGDTSVNAGGSERCNGADDDCDFRVDEALDTPAGICLALGVCAQAAPLCLQGDWDCRYPTTQGDEADYDCDNLDNDCDGITDEYHDTQTNPEHCGRCGNRCTFANAVPACNAGRCEMGPCRAGWVDLNGVPADGCEVECFFQSADDRPDRGNVDANCDGLDGDAARAVYVDAIGGDDGFDGSKRTPLRTLAAAIALAAERGHDVYASQGVYPERVEVVAGVSIYGGYDAARGWRRDGGLETIVRGGVRSLVARGVMTPTELQRLRIESTDAAAGEASIAVTIVESIGLTLRDCTVIAGRGGDGARGRDGGSGQIGQPGTLGQDAQDSSNVLQDCDRRQGGPGGQTVCDDGATHGGRGGNGGEGDENGSTGGAGQGPTGGGAGGGGGAKDGSCGDTDPGLRGGTGTRGNAGADGAAGQGPGQIVAGEWVGASGGEGAFGTSGSGGGGGGGGGGQEERVFRIPPCDQGCGGGGGGGGAGGCRGTPATGGGAGGASIAVLIIDANPSLIANDIRAGRGGTGGEGGRGGEGGAGGGPGGGGPRYDDIGGGGQGGPGGDGGRGGHGGGGAGGPSIGVATTGSSMPELVDNTFTLAGGGERGPSPGNPGAVGVAVEVQPL